MTSDTTLVVNVHLPPLERRVLERLALAGGRVVSRNALLQAMYEGKDEPDCGGNLLSLSVVRLRRKFGRDLIECLRGQGYRLTRKVEFDTRMQIDDRAPWELTDTNCGGAGADRGGA